MGSEFVLGVLSTYLGLHLLLNNAEENPAKKFLGVGIITLAMFGFASLIYTILKTEAAIIVLLKVGMIALLSGVWCLSMTMQVLVKSSAWINEKNPWLWLTLIVTISIGFMLALLPYIIVIDPISAETQFDTVPFLIFALWVGTNVLYSIWATYTFGIQKTTGESRQNLIYFMIGLILLVVGQVIDVIGNSFENLESYFDSMLFFLCALGSVFLFKAFPKKKAKTDT